MKFIKTHGLGNDFVLIDGRKPLHGTNYSKLARKICQRRISIGADGLIVFNKSKSADMKMNFYNPDGSEAEMCGNGIRCLAKYLYEYKIVSKKVIKIETLRGSLKLKLFVEKNKVKAIEVDMNRPIFAPAKIPVKIKSKGPIVDFPLKLMNEIYRTTCLSMGNPHCVVFTENLDKIPVTRLGPLIENHPLFPERINVEFVQVISPNHIKAIIWERGAGLTLSSGTGACAAAVASILNKKTNRRLKVTLPGGKLFVEWDKNKDTVLLRGPAEVVFEGEIIKTKDLK